MWSKDLGGSPPITLPIRNQILAQLLNFRLCTSQTPNKKKRHMKTNYQSVRERVHPSWPPISGPSPFPPTSPSLQSSMSRSSHSSIHLVQIGIAALKKVVDHVKRLLRLLQRILQVILLRPKTVDLFG